MLTCISGSAFVYYGYNKHKKCKFFITSCGFYCFIGTNLLYYYTTRLQKLKEARHGKHHSYIL